MVEVTVLVRMHTVLSPSASSWAALVSSVRVVVLQERRESVSIVVVVCDFA